MRTRKLTIFSLLAISVLAAAMAGCGKGPDHFAKADTDGDGVLTQDELNWNGDEFVNEADLPGVKPQRVEAFMKAGDSDDDKKLTREEFNIAYNKGRIPIWIILAVVVAVIAIPLVVGDQLAKMLKMNDYGWKLGLILVTVTAGTVITIFGWPPKRGIDLSGGVILIYEIDSEATEQAGGEALRADEKVKPADLVPSLSKRVNPSGTKEVIIRPYGDQQIEIVIPEVDPAEVEDIKRKIAATGQLEFLIVANSRDHSDLITLATSRTENSETNSEHYLRDPEGNVIGRWVPVGVTDAQRGEAPEYRGIRVAAAQRDVLRARRGPGGTQSLFEIVDFSEFSQAGTLKESFDRLRYRDLEVLMVVNEREALNVKGDHLRSASIGMDGTGGYAVDFVMNSRGEGLMGALTGSNLPDSDGTHSRRLGIVMDGDLMSAPDIRGQIRRNGQITGNFSKEEVDWLVNILKAGRLPAVLKETPIAENEVSSLLGADTIRKGSIAIGISLAAVLIFMVIYYHFSGIVACMALVVNLILILAVMISIKAAFTLPGLAGLVLTVGMSVDANVLIFERIREELNRGAALRMAIRNGFGRATTTIVDANLTTLITAIVLYAIGTDQIRGFAVTLILGILMSMYTAIFCSRVLFDIAERKRWISKLSMLRIVGETKINFLGKRYIAGACSAVLIAIGLVAIVARGPGILDIDFTGGTSVQTVFKEPTTTEHVREKTSHLPDVRVINIQVQGEKENTIYQIDSGITGEEAEDPTEGIRVLYLSPVSGKVEVVDVTKVDSASKTVSLKQAAGAETYEDVKWDDLIRGGVNQQKQKVKEAFPNELVLQEVTVGAIEAVASAGDVLGGAGEPKPDEDDTDEPKPEGGASTGGEADNGDTDPMTNGSSTPDETTDGGDSTDSTTDAPDTSGEPDLGNPDGATTQPNTTSTPDEGDTDAPPADSGGDETEGAGTTPAPEENSALIEPGATFVSLQDGGLLAQADEPDDSDAADPVSENAATGTDSEEDAAAGETTDPADGGTIENTTTDATDSPSGDTTTEPDGTSAEDNDDGSAAPDTGGQDTTNGDTTAETTDPMSDDSALVDTGAEDDAPKTSPVAGRSRATLTFGHPVTAADVRTEVTGAAMDVLKLEKELLVQVSNDDWDGESNDRYGSWTVELPVNEETAAKILNRVKQKLTGEPVWLSSNAVGGQVAGNTQAQAIGALLLSLIFIIGYIWIRFQRVVFGLAAVVALVHDVLITLGAIAVSLWLADGLGFLMIEEFKISLPVVAAFLTIIGYSLNDTIVVFDRIREVRGKNPDITEQMINSSINQTLSRTLLTSVTTLLVVLILYFLGGQGIHSFAFALVVGVMVGTYSSIFVASPCLLWMAQWGQESNQGAAAKLATAGTSAAEKAGKSN